MLCCEPDLTGCATGSDAARAEPRRLSVWNPYLNSGGQTNDDTTVGTSDKEVRLRIPNVSGDRGAWGPNEGTVYAVHDSVTFRALVCGGCVRLP